MNCVFKKKENKGEKQEAAEGKEERKDAPALT